MYKKYEAMVVLDCDPFSFRSSCEKYGIDPDGDSFSMHDIRVLKGSISKGAESIPSGVNRTITVAEILSTLNIDRIKFNNNLAKQMTRVSRGIYCRDSFEKHTRDHVVEDGPPQAPVVKDDASRALTMIDRISIDKYEDGSGSSITIYLKNVDADALLNSVLGVL